MTDLWGFLLQTLYVSLVGGLLLVVKGLLQDKLTPRWQYGVWTVLALRILLPVQIIGKYILLPLPLWVETAKTLVERKLDSAYSSVFLPTEVAGPVPLVSARPESITDWLFLLYAVGAVVMLARYLVSYFRLRRLVSRGTPASDTLQAQINRIGEKYRLKSCRAVVIQGLPSPMVFGIFRPVLAVPAGASLDDHVILHELLHVKHHDALQNVLWCVCRALHWCNPFLHFLINRIGNDMESLCDQRVLERLEGEERREYGISLLAMANDRYPRAPGTTSVSNGGKNIARRIEAIVRFKKYPKGMALASVCVTVILMCGCLAATGEQELTYHDSTEDGLLTNARSLAELKLTQCTTAAGALDTYAKGLKYYDQRWLALASPASHKEDILADSIPFLDNEDGLWDWKSQAETGLNLSVYEVKSLDDPPYAELVETGWVEDIQLSQTEYEIYNLEYQTDGSYTALLTFFFDNVQTLDGQQLWWSAEYGDTCAVATYPVRVFQEDGWVVEETGTRTLYLLNGTDVTTFCYRLFPTLRLYQGKGTFGSVKARIWRSCDLEDSIGLWERVNVYSIQYPCPAAEFGTCYENYNLTYTYGAENEDTNLVHQAGIQLKPLNKDGSMPEFEDLPGTIGGQSASGNSSSGTAWSNEQIEGNWNGIIETGGGWGGTGNPEESAFSVGYVIHVWLNSELRETIVLEEVPND